MRTWTSSAAERPGAGAPTSLILLSDADTLLPRREDGSWGDPSDAVSALIGSGVPLVLVSQRGAAELRALQWTIGLHHPFICENGAALHIPPGYFEAAPDSAPAGSWEVVEFGARRDAVCEALARLAGVMGIGVLPCCSGSSAAGTARAMDVGDWRGWEYTEPFRIAGDCRRLRAEVVRALHTHGFRCISRMGLYFATAVQDPGDAVRLLIDLYRASRGPVTTIGLGAEWDDRTILKAADVPVVVRTATGNQGPLRRLFRNAYYTDAVGPAGWSEAVLGSAARA